MDREFLDDQDLRTLWTIARLEPIARLQDLKTTSLCVFEQLKSGFIHPMNLNQASRLILTQFRNSFLSTTSRISLLLGYSIQQVSIRLRCKTRLALWLNVSRKDERNKASPGSTACLDCPVVYRVMTIRE